MNPMPAHDEPPADPGHDDGVADTMRGAAAETGAVGYPLRPLPDPGDGDDGEPMPFDAPEFDDPDAIPTNPVQPDTGDRIGPYVLQDRLGHGVSAFVFRGWDEEHDCPVAVKIVNWANVYDRPAALKQMRTEAAALARVKHPRVVRFIDFGFDPRWPYLITEFVEGRPMGELLRGGGALPPEWAVYLVSQVLDGLGAVWRAGLVHRDIKPDNVLIGPNGVAKLIDFGLALAPMKFDAAAKSAPELAGTAAYVAPEQAKDASLVDLRADIYSLGATFYEALTGRLPFEGKNRVQMIFQHIHSAPVPPVDRVPTIPQTVSDLCLWMLAKNPDERPQCYDDLRQTFDMVMGVS